MLIARLCQQPATHDACVGQWSPGLEVPLLIAVQLQAPFNKIA